jgi:hypothetical protein
MKLHLHFLQAAGTEDQPKLAFTQFWASKDHAEPVTVTYGEFRPDYQLPHTQRGAKAICQLLLHRQPLKGELAKSLWDIARKVSIVSDGTRTVTHLQRMFGLKVGTKIPLGIIDYKKRICDIGSDLKNGSIDCFVYSDELSAKQAFLKAKEQAEKVAETNNKADLPRPLSSTECQQLGSELLGDVNITKCNVQVMKDSLGDWKDAADPDVLPLTCRDIFRLELACDKAAYLYVFWVGSSGESVTPLFPWLPTDPWDDNKASRWNRPRQQLVLTDDYMNALPPDGRYLQSSGKKGGETLVVLAHVKPLSLATLQKHFLGILPGLKGPIPWRQRRKVEKITLGFVEIVDEGKTSPSSTMDYRPAKGPKVDKLTRLLNRVASLPFRVDDPQALVIPTLGG